MAPETVNSNPLPSTRGIAQVVQHEEVSNRGRMAAENLRVSR